MGRAMKDSGVDYIGKIPVDWDVIKLKYLTECLDGRRKPVDSALRTSGIYPYWGAGSIQDYVDDYIFDEDLVLLGEDGAPFFDSFRPVAFAISGKVWVNNHIHVLKCTSAYNRIFLVHSLNSVDYRGFINGSILNKLTQGNMREISLCRPPLLEQNRIVAFLNIKCQKIDTAINQTRISIEEYQHLKQAVITQAVTKGVRGDRPMKESGIEWLNQIPHEWQVLQLGNVTINMRNGYVGPTRDLFATTGVRYIQSLHVKDGKIDFMRHPYFVRESWANQHPKIYTGDLLIVQTGDIGQVALVPDEYNGCNCHALIIATPNSEIINPLYLMYYLLSSVGKELLLLYKTGALLPHLNSGKIKNTPICVPSLNEQTEIVTYLDAKCAEIDALIAKKEQLLTELENYKKSLIYEYVTGKKEVTP